jgi:uncharacterized protein DUF4328
MPDDLINAQSAEQSRARWATYLLFACVALDVAGILSAQRVLLDGRYGAIGVLRLPVFIATAIVWLLWLHQAYRNLSLVGTMRSSFTPDRAVGCWFVPFINLVRPYQIVKELWQRSEGRNDRDSFDGLPAPALVSWWWGMFLLSGLGRLATLGPQAQSLKVLTTVADVGMLADAVEVVAALLAIRIVRGITDLQQLFQAQRLT